MGTVVGVELGLGPDAVYTELPCAHTQTHLYLQIFGHYTHTHTYIETNTHTYTQK